MSTAQIFKLEVQEKPRVYTPKERLEKAKAMTTAQLLDLVCPSDEFKADFNAINVRAKEAREGAEKAKRRLQITIENRETLEVLGRNPDGESREIKKIIAEHESVESRSRGELVDLFASEKEVFDLKRAAAWRTLYDTFIGMFETHLGEQLAQIKSTVDAASSEVLEALNTRAGSTTRLAVVLSRIDASAMGLNTFVGQTKLSVQQYGAENVLRSNLATAVRQVLAKLPMAEINMLLSAARAEQFQTYAQWRTAESSKPTNIKWMAEQGEAEYLKTAPPFETPQSAPKWPD